MISGGKLHQALLASVHFNMKGGNHVEETSEGINAAGTGDRLNWATRDDV